MKNIYWILFMHLFVINAAFTQNKNFADSRVLILYGKNYTQNTKYNILNPNKSFFASIKAFFLGISNTYDAVIVHEPSPITQFYPAL